jgi:hypothetical protein
VTRLPGPPEKIKVFADYMAANVPKQIKRSSQ